MNADTVAARSHGAGFEPEYPLLCAGLVVLPVADGLLFEGGTKRKLVTGEAATSVLPELVRLLDGQHTPARLASTLGLTEGQVRSALYLLDQSGLLEWVDDGRGKTTPPDGNVATFLSRNLHTTRAYRNTTDALDALTRAAVLVVSPAAIAELITRDLHATGVGSVATMSRPEAVDGAALENIAGAAAGVVLVLDGPGRERALARLESLCRTHDVPMLRFARGCDRLEVGPLFYSSATACYTCFATGYAAMNLASRAHDTGDPEDAGDTAVETGDSLLAGMVTAEALAVVAMVTEPTSFRTLTKISLPYLVAERLIVAPEDGCVDCASQTHPSDGVAELATTYEWLLEKMPPELYSPARRAADHSGSRDARSSRPADFRTSPRKRLPVPSEFPVSQESWTSYREHGLAEPSCLIDEPTLAGMLLRVAGRTPAHEGPDIDYRQSSSAGESALDVYLRTVQGVFDGLPGNLFKYAGSRHELIALRPETVALRDFLDTTDLSDQNATVTFVFVGNMGRLFDNYQQAAYRLAHVDTGCAVGRLSAAAHGYGLAVSIASTWDERLADVLELRTEDEVITAVATIHRGKGERAADP